MVSLQAKGETILKLSPTCSFLEQPIAEVTCDAQFATLRPVPLTVQITRCRASWNWTAASRPHPPRRCQNYWPSIPSIGPALPHLCVAACARARADRLAYGPDEPTALATYQALHVHCIKRAGTQPRCFSSTGYDTALTPPKSAPPRASRSSLRSGRR